MRTTDGDRWFVIWIFFYEVIFAYLLEPRQFIISFYIILKMEHEINKLSLSKGKKNVENFSSDGTFGLKKSWTDLIRIEYFSQKSALKFSHKTHNIDNLSWHVLWWNHKAKSYESSVWWHQTLFFIRVLHSFIDQVSVSRMFHSTFL